MGNLIHLSLEGLETREVPADFVWVGGRTFWSEDYTNANKYENYTDTEKNSVNRMPTTGDRIIIDERQKYSMHILPGNIVDCDSI